jgi:hypothetical protein
LPTNYGGDSGLFEGDAMKQTAVSLLTRLYAWLLRLYPASFRDAFGEEMTAVFSDALVDDPASIWSAIILFARELKDFPGNLLRQHWLAFKEDSNPMTTLAESNHVPAETRQPGSWGAAFLAGLPHLLMGALIGLGKLFVVGVYENAPTIPAVIGSALGLLVVAALVLAWRHGWPLWSASWYLYGIWVTMAILSLTVENLNLEESWRYTNALFFGWILVCIIGYVFLLTQSKLHGLLSVAFLFPLLGVMMLEFVPDPVEGWLGLGLGLMTAVTAATIVRQGSFRTGLALVLGLNLAAGLSLAYVGEYQIKDLPASLQPTPVFGNFLKLWGLYAFIALGIIALPFLVRGVWQVGRHKCSS